MWSSLERRRERNIWKKEEENSMPVYIILINKILLSIPTVYIGNKCSAAAKHMSMKMQIKVFSGGTLHKKITYDDMRWTENEL